MYPARFDYLAPTDIEDALTSLNTLCQEGDEAKILAGGQSLIPLMKLRLASPATLVDINRLPGLAFIEPGDGHLRIGALTRHNDLAESDLLRQSNHTMAAAAPWIADPLVRNLGTIGGSLAHADPQGDWASVMLACGADIVTRSAAGERIIPIGDFLLGVFTTALRPDELLTEIRVPLYRGPAGGTYLKLERKVGDYATVGVAVHLQLDEAKERIAEAGIALTSVAPSNVKAMAAEQVLIGQVPDDQLFAEASDLASRAAEPRSDIRGSAEYKRNVVRVFVGRGLTRAMELARAA